MIPAYRNMDSYPFHRNQIPFPYYYHPSMEHVTPQMTKSPYPYEQPWPYASSYGPHFCYSHMPSYPHVPYSSPMFCSGGGPGYFVPYSPQSHYGLEVPRYEYDKYMLKDRHCCGCSNHSCCQKEKEDRTVTIEEQKPNLGKKENDPMEFRNFPYPLVWVPPEYYGNRQMKNPTGVDEEDKMSHDKKLTRAEDSDMPRLWNGWLPFDVKGVPNMYDNVGENGNEKMDQKHQSEQQNRSEFPFPFIWFPSYNNQQDGGRTNNQKSCSVGQEGVEEVPHTFKSVPVKSCGDEGVVKRTNSNDVESRERRDFDFAEKVSNQRNIPVKQIESNHVKNSSMESEKREMNVPEENVEKKYSHSVSKQRSTSPTSPTKGSKLPPVCLRVDPLPRKKNGNMKSRSLSPPGLRERSKAIDCETSNTPLDSRTDKTELCSTNQVSQNKTNENLATKTAVHEDGKKERRVLSDADAAVVIQTIYRGYLVRKSEPLKKLRQIAEVSKEVTYVKDRIEVFEGSSNLQTYDKEKLAIGETIMRLLLKLDTIQGLHPSLREIRKSLARELVTLQEKLDSIMLKKPPQQQMQELDAKKHLQISLPNVQNGEHNQEKQEEKVASQKDSSEGISDGKPQDQLCMMDVNGVSETQSHVGPGSNEGTKTTILPNGLFNLDISPVELESEVIDIPTEVDKLNMNAFKELPVGVIDEDTTEDSASERLDSDMRAIKELPMGVLDEDAATSQVSNTSENDVFIKELPVELLDENAEKSEAERPEYKEKDTELEQPLVEEKEGVQSSEESDGWLKIEFQKQDDELKMEEPMETEESEPMETEESGEGIGNDTNLPSLGNEENDVANIMLNDTNLPSLGNEENDVANIMLNDTNLPSLGNEEENDVANIMLNENDPKESLEQQETHIDVQDTVAGETNSGDDKNTENLAKEETEPSVDLSVSKHNSELKGNMMLLEENEKLRKLMKELLEAGNEQLSVISNLTGRVKDLEKKLAKTRKSKKVKTKRHRSVTPKVSCDYSTE
ncbi:unnamed protein product [Lathyrus sativus]|nr:unnamed protein product [Lathyrus sativus]